MACVSAYLLFLYKELLKLFTELFIPALVSLLSSYPVYMIKLIIQKHLVLLEMCLVENYHPVKKNKTKTYLPYCVKKSNLTGIDFSLVCKKKSQGMCLICQTCCYRDLLYPNSNEKSDSETYLCNWICI